MLACGDGSLYTGYTPHLEARLAAHACGKGARYTRGRGPIRLAIAWGFTTRSEAMKVEARIKRLERPAKLALLASPETLEQFGFHPRVIHPGDPEAPALTGAGAMGWNPDPQAVIGRPGPRLGGRALQHGLDLTTDE